MSIFLYLNALIFVLLSLFNGLNKTYDIAVWQAFIASLLFTMSKDMQGKNDN